MNSISSQPVIIPNRGQTICHIGQIGYLVISLLFALVILFQLLLAGGGIFASSSWWAMHRIFGYALTLFPVALLVLAVVGRQSWLKVGLNGLAIVLVVLQGAIINVAESIGLPLLSALPCMSGCQI